LPKDIVGAPYVQNMNKLNTGWGGSHVSGSLKMHAIDRCFIKAFLDPKNCVYRRPTDKVVPTALC